MRFLGLLIIRSWNARLLDSLLADPLCGTCCRIELLFQWQGSCWHSLAG